MMPSLSGRVPFSPQRPYRSVRPATSKIIFLSLEGAATEHEYFDRISELFDQLKYRLQLISVSEDAVLTPPKVRTAEQTKMLSKVRPLQLVNRIEWYKQEYNHIYEFDKHPEDEYWIVTDVDDNWSDLWISEWNDAIRFCAERHYHYAVSNPFFEVWLLLHHDNPTDEDKSFAVTDERNFQPTNHFRLRLRELGFPLHKDKHIRKQNYSVENVRNATMRAADLHLDRSDPAPHYFSTTVYLLLEKLFSMLDDTETAP